MQTFLPSPNFRESAQVLDYRRLGKQRVEAKQIMTALIRSEGAWYNHPAVQMWKGFEVYLALYTNEMITEWAARGYKNNMELYTIDRSEKELKNHNVPFWFNDERLYSSHRAALLYKNHEHYKQFNWLETPKLSYFWPTKHNEER